MELKFDDPMIIETQTQDTSSLPSLDLQADLVQSLSTDILSQSLDLQTLQQTEILSGSDIQVD